MAESEPRVGAEVDLVVSSLNTAFLALANASAAYPPTPTPKRPGMQSSPLDSKTLFKTS
jgi:hypothetical protein